MNNKLEKRLKRLKPLGSAHTATESERSLFEYDSRRGCNAKGHL